MYLLAFIILLSSLLMVCDGYPKEFETCRNKKVYFNPRRSSASSGTPVKTGPNLEPFSVTLPPLVFDSPPQWVLLHLNQVTAVFSLHIRLLHLTHKIGRLQIVYKTFLHSTNTIRYEYCSNSGQFRNWSPNQQVDEISYEEPIMARYINITAWEFCYSFSAYFGVLGCQMPAVKDILSTGFVTDLMFEGQEDIFNPNNVPMNARENRLGGAFCTNSSRESNFLQISFPFQLKIYSMKMRGELIPPYDYVTSYNVHYSFNKRDFYPVKENGKIKIFQGPCKNCSLTIEQTMNTTFRAKHLRIYPLTGSNMERLCFAVDVTAKHAGVETLVTEYDRKHLLESGYKVPVPSSLEKYTIKLTQAQFVRSIELELFNGTMTYNTYFRLAGGTYYLREGGRGWVPPSNGTEKSFPILFDQLVLTYEAWNDFYVIIYGAPRFNYVPIGITYGTKRSTGFSIRSSSDYDYIYRSWMTRFKTFNHGWVPKTLDNAYLEFDFKRILRITGMILYCSGYSSTVWKVFLTHSDGFLYPDRKQMRWSTYMEANTKQEFVVHTQYRAANFHVFEAVILARFIRIIPLQQFPLGVEFIWQDIGPIKILGMQKDKNQAKILVQPDQINFRSKRSTIGIRLFDIGARAAAIAWKDYVQIDFCVSTIIKGLSMLGRKYFKDIEFITSVAIHYSLDRIHFFGYYSNELSHVSYKADGNSDNVSQMVFVPFIVALAIRIHLVTTKGREFISLEIYGSAQASYSSSVNLTSAQKFIDQQFSTGKQGQINASYARLTSDSIWITENAAKPWIQVTLGKVYRITGVITRTSAIDGLNFITSYYLYYKSRFWLDLKPYQVGGSKQLLYGNRNHNSLILITRMLEVPVSATVIKVEAYGIMKTGGFRFELLGALGAKIWSQYTLKSFEKNKTHTMKFAIMAQVDVLELNVKLRCKPIFMMPTCQIQQMEEQRTSGLLSSRLFPPSRRSYPTLKNSTVKDSYKFRPRLVKTSEMTGTPNSEVNIKGDIEASDIPMLYNNGAFWLYSSVDVKHDKYLVTHYQTTTYKKKHFVAVETNVREENPFLDSIVPEGEKFFLIIDIFHNATSNSSAFNVALTLWHDHRLRMSKMKPRTHLPSHTIHRNNYSWSIEFNKFTWKENISLVLHLKVINVEDWVFGIEKGVFTLTASYCEDMHCSSRKISGTYNSTYKFRRAFPVKLSFGKSRRFVASSNASNNLIQVRRWDHQSWWFMKNAPSDNIKYVSFYHAHPNRSNELIGAQVNGFLTISHKNAKIFDLVVTTSWRIKRRCAEDHPYHSVCLLPGNGLHGSSNGFIGQSLDIYSGPELRIVAENDPCDECYFRNPLVYHSKQDSPSPNGIEYSKNNILYDNGSKVLFSCVARNGLERKRKTNCYMSRNHGKSWIALPSFILNILGYQNISRQLFVLYNHGYQLGSATYSDKIEMNDITGEEKSLLYGKNVIWPWISHDEESIALGNNFEGSSDGISTILKDAKKWLFLWRCCG